jgi:hypothetical protein
MTQTPKPINRTFLHSSYIPDIGTNEDAVIVSEIVEFSDGTTRPNLRKIKAPNVPYWVTKPQMRVHTEKKEFEALDRLDEFRVSHKQKDQEIFRTLNDYYPSFMNRQMRQQCYESPYVYGANIDIEALVAMRYKKDMLAAGKTPQSPTTGFFDIEKSLLPSSLGQLPLMVFTAENQVYLAIKSCFMWEERDGKTVKVTVDDIVREIPIHIDPLVNAIFAEHTDLQPLKDKLPFQYHFFVGETELEMIQWITDRMHESKVSFIGIWNLGFDIPEIIKILEENNIPLESVFADPSLRGTGYARASYREDKRKVDHFSKKWHWLTTSSYFQFIDSMALYSYIRTVNGKESSYALDDILKQYGLGGKLKIAQTDELKDLQTADWHRAMLSRFFTYYALYAMWDGMSLQILEWLNKDITAMVLQADTTPRRFFPNQTIRVTNSLYERWLKDRQVLGTGVAIAGLGDDDLLTEGGAVLNPQHLVAHGLSLFIEFPDHKTHCFAWENDFDFSAQYPTNIVVGNISKQTKVGTMLKITGSWVQKYYTPKQAVEVYCSYLVTPQANAVNMGVEFYGLPTYGQMDRLFSQHLQTQQVG